MRANLIAIFAAGLSLSVAGCTLGMYDNDDDDDDWIEASDAGPAPWDGYTPWPDAAPALPDGGSAPWPDAQVLPEDGGSPGPDAGPIDPPDDAGPYDLCPAINLEAVCVVTPECDAVYVGVDCECYDDGTCECTSWEFLECR